MGVAGESSQSSSAQCSKRAVKAASSDRRHVRRDRSAACTQSCAGAQGRSNPAYPLSLCVVIQSYRALRREATTQKLRCALDHSPGPSSSSGCGCAEEAQIEELIDLVKERNPAQRARSTPSCRRAMFVIWALEACLFTWSVCLDVKWSCLYRNEG